MSPLMPREEGEIESDSEHLATLSDIDEEERIDRELKELNKARDAIAMNSKKHQEKIKKSPKKVRSHRTSKDKVSTNEDNYEVVSMDVANEEDDADVLRQMLLEQMSRKKATNTPPDPAPSLRPPLSPPRSSESLLPPPPLPPASLSPFVPFNIPNRITPETNNVLSDLSTDRQSSQNDMEIEPYSPRPLPEGRQIIHDDYEDVSEEIGPKSPDAVSEVDIEEELKDSDDDFILDELSDYELDVDFVKSENRSCKKELQKLLKRQKHNTNSFNDAKKDVESLKEELQEKERKLSIYAERGADLNIRIYSLMEKVFESQSSRIELVKSEREKWKGKVNKAYDQGKERVKLRVKKNLKGRVHNKTKNIPLDVNPSVASSFLVSPVKSTRKETRRAKTNETPREIDNSRINTSLLSVQNPETDDNYIPLTSIGSRNTSGMSAFNQDPPTVRFEQELYNRLVNRKNIRDTPPSINERLPLLNTPSNSSTGIALLSTDTFELDDSNHTVPQEPDCMSISPASTETPLPNNKGTAILDLSSFSMKSLSLQESVGNPLLHLKSYRLYPTFPFDHISHPALSSKINAQKPFCPFELNGICADQDCEMQHDRDIRVTEEEIVREMISYYPQLCPLEMRIEEYARYLLERAKIDVVARFVASSIPAEVRDSCFSEELKLFVSSEGT